mmetsp:Transcript_20933/g.41034  ORF Transcript_20933/g.41034 Transcript_20933/m.41034 type:complete len:95 (-) Transcript_20933:145-429(-)
MIVCTCGFANACQIVDCKLQIANCKFANACQIAIAKTAVEAAIVAGAWAERGLSHATTKAVAPLELSSDHAPRRVLFGFAAFAAFAAVKSELGK